MWRGKKMGGLGVPRPRQQGSFPACVTQVAKLGPPPSLQLLLTVAVAQTSVVTPVVLDIFSCILTGQCRDWVAIILSCCRD